MMQRTEVQTGAAKQCQICGQLTYFHELTRQRCAVGENRFYLWRLIPLHSFVQYEPRDLCPTCVGQSYATERKRRIRLGALLLGGLVTLQFGHLITPYVTPQAFWLVVLAIGWRQWHRWRYRNRKALITR